MHLTVGDPNFSWEGGANVRHGDFSERKKKPYAKIREFKHVKRGVCHQRPCLDLANFDLKQFLGVTKSPIALMIYITNGTFQVSKVPLVCCLYF